MNYGATRGQGDKIWRFIFSRVPEDHFYKRALIWTQIYGMTLIKSEGREKSLRLRADYDLQDVEDGQEGNGRSNYQAPHIH